MPPRDHRSVTPETRRLSSASNSISSSPSHADEKNEASSSTPHNNKRINWSVVIPVVGRTILSWALQANARVRQHASACCTGDFCVGAETTGEMIPEEIVFQCRRPKTNSSVNSNSNDIELEEFSVIGTGSLVNTKPEYEEPWKLPIRRTKWNELPEDPVDEVSLKGSSSYLSSSDDEVYEFQRGELETELRRPKQR